MKKQKKKLTAIILACILAISSLAVQPVRTQAAKKKVTAITLNAKSKTLYEGEWATLKIKNVTPAKGSKSVIWKTSNKKVATVTAKGKVTAKKKGTVKITAVSKSSGVKAVCKITVKKASMTRMLSLYKNKKYAKARAMSKKLPSKASEKCVEKMSKKMKKAYLKKVKKYKKHSQISSPGIYIWGYYLTDITNDGKAELIIEYGSCLADMRYAFYKYSKGKAVKIETIHFSHVLLGAYPNHKGIILQSGHMFFENISKVFIKKSKIEDVFIGERYIKDPDEWIELPYLLDNHVPSGELDVSYKALE